VNVLGVIPARGGSKGIPKKNIALCGGKPMLVWSCIAARDARCLTRTVISTDDPEFAALARSEGAEAPFLRPPELATDTARSIDVTNHAIDWLAREQGWHTDAVVLLQPTSPLRTASHIDEAFALLRPDVDSVVSVVEVPHRYKPWAVLEPDGPLVHYFAKDELPFDRYCRQGQPTLYTRNGPAVVVTHAAVLRTGVYYGERSVPYVMAHEVSVDVDEPFDLELCDWLLRRREALLTAALP
jgi:CMP-N,N'-diacetyllegionaminic acid synthase